MVYTINQIKVRQHMTRTDISEALQVLNLSLDRISKGILNPGEDKEAEWVRIRGESNTWDRPDYARYYSGQLQNCVTLIDHLITDIDPHELCEEITEDTEVFA